MTSSYLILLETATLVCLTGLLIMLYGMRRAPLGFQHYNLFYYGEPPAGLIPVESPDIAPAARSNWR